MQHQEPEILGEDLYLRSAEEHPWHAKPKPKQPGRTRRPSGNNGPDVTGRLFRQSHQPHTHPQPQSLTQPQSQSQSQSQPQPGANVAPVERVSPHTSASSAVANADAKVFDDIHQRPSPTYVSPSSQNPSPGRSHFITSAVEAPSHVRSPTSAYQQPAANTESEAGSLNDRFGRSTLSGRNGAQAASHTQRSTTSQKRTIDATSQSESRPAKQPYSPSAPISLQMTNASSQPQPQSQQQRRRGPNIEPSSPVTTSTGMRAHYTKLADASPDTQKHYAGSPPLSPSSNTSETALVKQPATRPITEQQLINEVKGIYAGLVMVERKCVDIIDQQTRSNKRLTDQQWKALVALHRTLLQEHHDFFSASQHPTASDNLKKLAIKYAMPARMWRHGIHAFLELLRHRLPDSMEHMLSFIYLAYSMMALLKESVPSFVETWIECLGDLARYRMAIEDSDPRDREVWSNVAKVWYNEAADKSPNVGRIQHHLAVLARPNIVEQLFYYDKALVSIVPFVNARESIMLLFDMFLKNNEAVQSRYPPTEYAFVYFYALLFTRQSPKECQKMLELFVSSYGGHMDRAGARFKLQGPEMAAALFSGLLDFGKESYLWNLFVRQLEDAETRRKAPDGQTATSLAMEARNNLARHKGYWAKLRIDTQLDRMSASRSLFDQDSIERSEDVIAIGSYLVKEAITLVASRVGDKNIVPFMHVILANLWGMSFVEGALTYIEGCIPWSTIVLFLNTLGKSGVSFPNVESEDFPPSHGGHGRQLPEDFIMRGMMICRHYYGPDFFAEPLVDEDERTIELPSHQSPRAERCLWLGVRLSSLGRYLTYDTNSREFDTTQFAKSLTTLYN